MAVTITGGKYAIRSLSAAGTTTVTIGTGTFVSGDFGATQRMVSLFTSANVFKGIAWVRRFTSTTVLELENRFVDPVTGVYATQAVGDQVLVSINNREVSSAGWAFATPDNNVVTVTDNILMGTAGSEVSLCYYDQNIQFTQTNGFRFNGGVAVFGKLMSYDGVSKESFIWSRECTVRPNEAYPGAGGSPAYNVWGTGGTSAHMFFFGGAVGSPMRRSFFIGAEGTGATNKTFAFFGTRLYHACASPSNGANWASNPERHLLFKTIHEADYNNANLIVWGNGAFQGSFLSFPQFGAGTPLGIFRAASAVTFGASANNRTIVADTGSGSFIDDINNGSYTFTNVITPAVTIARFAGGNVPITFQFSDDYTNLQPRTTLVVRRGDGTTVSSVVNTTSSTFTATVVQATYSATGNGAASPTNFYTTFNYGIKCYGFQVISGTHTPYTYSLGTAGNGTDLKLGGLINQVADAGVTLTETEALALSSKFTVNSGTSTVTVTSNATLDELFDYTVAWNCASAANAVIPNLQRYLLTYDGTSLFAPTGWTIVVNNGVTLSAGTKYDFVSFPTVTLTGSGQITAVYSSNAGTSTVWEFQDVAVGSSLVIYNSSGTTLYYRDQVTSAGDYAYYIPPGVTGTYTWAIEKYGSQRQSGTFAANTGGLLFYVPIYVEDVGITETTQATVAAYTQIENAEKFYDYTAFFRLGEQGIKIGQIATRSGTSIEVQSGLSHVIRKTPSIAVYAIAGGVITTKAEVYAGTSKYSTEILVPPATLTAHSNEVITIAVQDANGDSQVSINGGDGEFELWKVTTSTPTADYATGTLLDTVGNGIYRFIGVSGFDIVGVDTNSNIRRRTSMAKGIYTQAFYVGDQIQLAQAPEVLEILTKVEILQINVDDLQDSVDALPEAVLTSEVETGANVVESLRLHNSVLGGVVSGGGSGVEVFRDLANTKDRLVSTNTATGDRTAEVYDLT
jgi:hypothetical protein